MIRIFRLPKALFPLVAVDPSRPDPRLFFYNNSSRTVPMNNNTFFAALPAVICFRAVQLSARLTRIKFALATATLMACACGDNKLPTEVVPGETSVYHGITLISIPGGSYQRGSNENEDTRPVRTIQISPFEISIYEITNSQYVAYLNEALASGDVTYGERTVITPIGRSDFWVVTPSNSSAVLITNSRGPLPPVPWIIYANGIFSVAAGFENKPVVNVTWAGAMAFAERYGLDLPTEAEWEYVCRGGKQLEYGTDDGTVSSEKANFYLDFPADVGSYPANPFGVFDTSGNLWEWCKDWYHKDYYSRSPSRDPQGPEEPDDFIPRRVIRGGSYALMSWISIVESYYRSYDAYSDTIGFRVVRRQ